MGEHKADDTILEVDRLKKYFPIQKGFLQKVAGYTKAVDNVSFKIKKGETLGMVGESGSGKTTVARCIVRLYTPTEGNVSIRSKGHLVDIHSMDKTALRNIRKTFTMLFQDPFSSLDPKMNVGNIITEPLEIHEIGNKEERLAKARDLLKTVGLSPDHITKYPHQFSGGQRQRIGIARALSLNPNLIICDEPVSALDVSVQAQVLNMLKDLQEEFNLSYLFIAHDLSVVEYISDRIIVMYLGKIMEIGSSDVIYNSPCHPYTEALLASISKHKARSTRKIILRGSIPDPSNPPAGCVFHTRCKYMKAICQEKEPMLEDTHKGESSTVACHRFGEIKITGYDTN